MQRSSTVSVRQGGAGGFFALPKYLVHIRAGRICYSVFLVCFTRYTRSSVLVILPQGVFPLSVYPPPHLPEGRLCSAVEGTPKGVQKRYASASQPVPLS